MALLPVSYSYSWLLVKPHPSFLTWVSVCKNRHGLCFLWLDPEVPVKGEGANKNGGLFESNLLDPGTHIMRCGSEHIYEVVGR